MAAPFTTTVMYYLEQKELYKTEKPYFIVFPVDDIPGASQSNMAHQPYNNVTVVNVQNTRVELDLDRTGFELAEYPSKFSYEDFNRFDAIRDAYFSELEQFLKTKFRATWVQTFDYDVRYYSS